MPRKSQIAKSDVIGESKPAEGWSPERTFWEARACGSRYANAGRGTLDYFQQADQVRYQTEPVERFADFSAQSGRKVLEIGTGMGGDLARFLAAEALAIGVDISSTALSVTSERLDLQNLPSRVSRADARDLPFADDSFDLVWSWGVLHHVVPIEQTIFEAHRVLAPGGALRIMLYHRPSWVALAAWVRWGLGRGRPFVGLKRVVSEHVESPGTLALTTSEIRQLLKSFQDVDVEIVGTIWDRRFMPILGNLLGSRFGWFALISARKESPNRLN